VTLINVLQSSKEENEGTIQYGEEQSLLVPDEQITQMRWSVCL